VSSLPSEQPSRQCHNRRALQQDNLIISTAASQPHNPTTR
jgi:hypothetical protein